MELIADRITKQYKNKIAVDRMSFTLTKGVTGLLGANGAGKTTMIKLLLRLYDPTEGVITLNGVDIKSYKREDYYRLFAPVFQDFKLFALSIKDNIDFGEGSDDSKVKELTKSVGLDEMVGKLEKGVDTNIFKYFDESGILKIILMHAETSGSDLHYRALRKRFQLRMKAALARVEKRAEIGGSHRQRFLSVEADRAEAHRRKHNRSFEDNLRRHINR